MLKKLIQNDKNSFKIINNKINYNLLHGKLKNKNS